VFRRERLLLRMSALPEGPPALPTEGAEALAAGGAAVPQRR
jgi:hypothetical protein